MEPKEVHNGLHKRARRHPDSENEKEILICVFKMTFGLQNKAQIILKSQKTDLGAFLFNSKKHAFPRAVFSRAPLEVPHRQNLIKTL